MVDSIAGGPGNFKWADPCLDHDAHNSVHGNTRLIGQKERLSCFVSCDQRDAVSQERWQLCQPMNVPCLEEVILVGNPPKENGGIPVFS